MPLILEASKGGRVPNGIVKIYSISSNSTLQPGFSVTCFQNGFSSEVRTSFQGEDEP